MKTFICKTLMIAIIFILRTDMYAGDPVKNDSIESVLCLEVVGIAVNEKNEPIDGVEVKLYKENEELEWVEITNVSYHDHNFIFKLDANQYYTIEISKAGYVKRSVAISTAIPQNVDLEILFKYVFEVGLFREKKGMDDFYLDFPVALISYNEQNEVFENSNSYTKHIKTKIKESENKVETRKN